MRIKMKVSMADQLRSWQAGQEYVVSDKFGQNLIELGRAELVPGEADRVVQLLGAMGGGLVVTHHTARDLVASARLAKLLIVKKAAEPEAKAKRKVASGSDSG